MITTASSLAPDDADLRSLCGDVAAVAGHWGDAAAAYAQAREVRPDDWNFIFRHALLQVAADDEAGYRATCRDFVARYRSAEALNVMFAVAVACTTSEGAVDDWEPIIDMGRKLAAKGGLNPAYRAALGSVLCRAGLPGEAVEELKRAIPMHAVAAMAAPRQVDGIELSRIGAERHLALAYRAMGKETESRQALDRAWQAIARLEKVIPHYEQGLFLWSARYGAHVAKRKLAEEFGGYAGPDTLPPPPSPAAAPSR